MSLRLAIWSLRGIMIEVDFQNNQCHGVPESSITRCTILTLTQSTPSPSRPRSTTITLTLDTLAPGRGEKSWRLDQVDFFRRVDIAPCTCRVNWRATHCRVNWQNTRENTRSNSFNLTSGEEGENKKKNCFSVIWRARPQRMPCQQRWVSGTRLSWFWGFWTWWLWNSFGMSNSATTLILSFFFSWVTVADSGEYQTYSLRIQKIVPDRCLILTPVESLCSVFETRSWVLNVASCSMLVVPEKKWLLFWPYGLWYPRIQHRHYRHSIPWFLFPTFSGFSPQRLSFFAGFFGFYSTDWIRVFVLKFSHNRIFVLFGGGIDGDCTHFLGGTEVSYFRTFLCD